MFDQSSINCTVFSMLGDATVVEGVSIIINLHEVIKIDNFSSVNKLLLITSYVMRIINNLLYRIKGRKKQVIGYVSTEELMHTELMCVRTEQLLAKKLNIFSDIYQSLNLKYDSDSVLRLHGRLPNVLAEVDIKHPISPRTDSTFTKLLILQAHEKTGYAGINSNLNKIRSRYLFSRGRKRILSIIKDCIICNKAQCKTMKGPEPPIPPDYRSTVILFLLKQELILLDHFT